MPDDWEDMLDVAGAEAQQMLPVLFDIVCERGNQVAEFPAAKDDALTPPEWIARLAKHLGRAVTLDPAAYRREIVVVAALAVAALEAHDRRFPG